MCGGTDVAQRRLRARDGLSPRVRGNRSYATLMATSQRSIPACAGEPRQYLRVGAVGGVYPRVCGGTATSDQGPDPTEGLSPRVRGNHTRRIASITTLRSIPACAGEPVRERAVAIPVEVYPRVCGGTGFDGRLPPRPQGLSPRVRGNPYGYRARRAREGSIPACAGEPDRGASAPGPDWVYPRVCGGTFIASPRLGARRGLSPRVRGNPRGRREDRRDPGSIPACAGEP